MNGVQRGPFDVLPHQLELLSAEEAVYLVRDLLLTEAKSIGVPTTGVNVPLDINVPDGGIDAELVIPAASTLPAKREHVSRILEGEKNENARTWLREEIDDLTGMIEAERTRELDEDESV